jgi:hypothetical protein
MEIYQKHKMALVGMGRYRVGVSLHRALMEVRHGHAQIHSFTTYENTQGCACVMIPLGECSIDCCEDTR